jgi:rhodanese-related sulfurtransferase
MGLKNRKGNNNASIIDVIVIIGVLIFAGFMYNNSQQGKQAFAQDPNFIKGASDIKSLLQAQIQNTPLDPAFDHTKAFNKLKSFGYRTVSLVNQIPFISSVFHFINKNQGFVHQCSNDGQFVDSTIPKIRYPLDITKKELQQKIKDYPDLMILDVRDEEAYVKKHIKGSVTIPLLELADQIFILNRWTEIVVVGDSYQQTKLASEALLRLNFQRLHRLIVPVSKWGKDLESFE